jgi:hypothetical protein
MKGKKSKGPQYANNRSTAPQTSPRPTPRPYTMQEAQAVRRGNRSAEMIARQEEILRRR